MGKETFVLAVATDLHYLSSKLYDDGEAFSLQTRFSDGALTQYGDEILRAFVRGVRRQRPDALLLCGDLTFNGEKESLAFLSSAFEDLGQAGIPVLAIPGNHDIKNPLAASYIGKDAKPAEGVTKEEFRSLLKESAPRDPGAILFPDPSSLGFVYAALPDLWFLCWDLNGNGWPGVLTDENLGWAESVLKEARRQNIRVIGVSHQNVMPHNSLFSAGFVCAGAEKILALYEDFGVRLHLSGHMHVQIHKEQGGVTEIVTSSLMVPPCQFGLLTVTQDSAQYKTMPVDVSGWAREQGRKDENLLSFAGFASRFYREVLDRRLTEELKPLALTDVEKKELALAAEKINQAFFAGTLSSLTESSAYRAIWKEKVPDSFWNQYMDSLFAEGISDESEVTVALR